MDVFKHHVESGGRGSLRVEHGEDGARRIYLSLDLKEGLVWRRRKPPGRRRRDQLRRETWLRRKEERIRSPPGDGVGCAPGRENRLDSCASSTPGVEGGEEKKGDQAASSRLDTDQHGNSGATSHHDGVEGERIFEDTAPAPEERQGEKLDNQIVTTEMDFCTAALETIEGTPDEPNPEIVTTPSGSTLSRLQPASSMVPSEDGGLITFEEHVRRTNERMKNFVFKPSPF